MAGSQKCAPRCRDKANEEAAEGQDQREVIAARGEVTKHEGPLLHLVTSASLLVGHCY